MPAIIATNGLVGLPKVRRTAASKYIEKNLLHCTAWTRLSLLVRLAGDINSDATDRGKGMSDQKERREAFRSAIAAYISEQREAKLKGREAEAGTDAAAKYHYETWLINTANRADEVQLVSHPLKATYPDAKIRETTSPLLQAEELPNHKEIGSHLISREFFDGTGNAAAIGTFKFLAEVLVDGHPLIYWLLRDDSDLLYALSADRETAVQIASSFKRIDRRGQPAASHGGAKQIFWLIHGDPSKNENYHLLQPMFSSSLAQVVHADIQNSRFSDESKTARAARRANKSHDVPCRDYRNLAVRKLGGTKPHNISYRNSERGGVNYLLASLPPKWTRESPANLLRMDSAMDRFGHFEGVRPLVKALADFLLANPSPTMETRRKREVIEQAIGFQLPLFAVGIQARLEPGWTRDPDCQLPLCEQVWLDPERIELPLREDAKHPEWTQKDLEFLAAHERGDWADEVAGRFANWLNAKLREAGLSAVGDTEYRHWAKQAIIEAAWPIPMQRRVASGGEA